LYLFGISISVQLPPKTTPNLQLQYITFIMVPMRQSLSYMLSRSIQLAAGIKKKGEKKGEKKGAPTPSSKVVALPET
jgi:hypothetical protein